MVLYDKKFFMYGNCMISFGQPGILTINDYLTDCLFKVVMTAFRSPSALIHALCWHARITLSRLLLYFLLDFNLSQIWYFLLVTGKLDDSRYDDYCF